VLSLFFLVLPDLLSAAQTSGFTCLVLPLWHCPACATVQRAAQGWLKGVELLRLKSLLTLQSFNVCAGSLRLKCVDP
jgi:hypothetical protein